MARQTNRRPNPLQEEEEVVKAYNHVSESGKRSNKKSRSKGRIAKLLQSNRIIVIAAICTAVLAIVIGVITGFMYLSSNEGTGTILENVTVAGVNVGGMTKEDAVNAVRLATDRTYSQMTMIVKVLDREVQIPASVAKISLNVKDAVDAAYVYGRRGSKHQQTQEKNTAMTTGYAVNLDPYLERDSDAIKATLAELGAFYSTTLRQHTYDITGTRPSLDPSAEATTNQQLVITKGTPEYALSLDNLYARVIASYSANQFTTILTRADCPYTEPFPLDLDAVYKETYIAPVDATLMEGTYTVKEGTCGYAFDLDKAKDLWESLPYGETITLDFARIMPKVTGGDISETLFRDLLGTFTAINVVNEENLADLTAVMEELNGMIIDPGGFFSYNQTVGSIGGSDNYIISSALYYCAVVSDLDILVRSGATYASETYIPLGMDAAVNGTLDLRFRNITNAPLRIEIEIEETDITVSFIGTDDKDYYVIFDFKTLTTDSYKTGYQVMTPDNANGYTDSQVIVTPYTGYTVETTRYKYSKQTNTLISEEIEATTVYLKRDELICRIQEPEPSEPSEPSEPEPTEGTDPTNPANPTNPGGGLSIPLDSTVPRDPVERPAI